MPDEEVPAMGLFLARFHYDASTWGRLVEEPVDRAPAVRAVVEAAGGTFVDLFYRLDDFGGLLLFEAPDAAVAAQVGLTALSSGAFASVETTELLRSADTASLLTGTRDLAAGFRRPA